MRAFAKYALMRWFALLLSMLFAFEPAAIAQSEEPATPPPPTPRQCADAGPAGFQPAGA